MHNIVVGTFVLNVQLILYLSFGAAGWLMLRYCFRNTTETSGIFTVIFNAYWLWIIVWKLSFLFFYPIEAIQHPVNLLYFDGGERGIWAASMVASIYIAMKAVKLKAYLPLWNNILSIFLLTGWSVYQMIFFIIVGKPAWLHGASGILSAVILILLLNSLKGINSSKQRGFAVWFSIGHVLLGFFGESNRSIFILSFSKQQLFFLLTAMGLTGWGWLIERKQNGGVHG